VARSYVTLAAHTTEMVRLACQQCGRRWQYRKADADRALRAGKNMVDLRLELATGCPRIEAGRIMDLCGVYYPGRIDK
jgi:hypothetical protein